MSRPRSPLLIQRRISGDKNSDRRERLGRRLLKAAQGVRATGESERPQSDNVALAQRTWMEHPGGLIRIPHGALLPMQRGLSPLSPY